MKISIITVCLNSEKTILATLNSVLTQSYKNIEHIIVDGGSTDKTFEYLKSYPNPKKKIIINKKKGIYEAMNTGIIHSTGEFIGILNSDDIFNSENVIKDLKNIFVKNKNKKIFFGNVLYFKKKFTDIQRYYPANNFQADDLYNGLMPPHTASFIHKDIYKQVGIYNKEYIIAGDYDFFVRAIIKNKLNFKKINYLVTRMKSGGISGRNLKSHVVSTTEIIKSLKLNKLDFSLFNIILRFPIKAKQFLVKNRKFINKNFNLKIHKIYENKIITKIRLIKNAGFLNLNKNFVLSAMNLAFLGFFFKKDIRIHTTLINWPDGTFSKILSLNTRKVPGREIVRKLNFKNSGTSQITVVGNLSEFSKNYLKKLYNIKIKQIPLPYKPLDDLKKIAKGIQIKKSEFVFITLPTPKQEILADIISSRNPNHKIVCIGASIAIASGEEKEVPYYFYYAEFLWRLRYDTIRRLIRLFYSFYYFINGYFISKKVDSLYVKLLSKK
jgi:glycosyltransferase involved in cell wall biosynthesis